MGRNSSGRGPGFQSELDEGPISFYVYCKPYLWVTAQPREEAWGAREVNRFISFMNSW